MCNLHISCEGNKFILVKFLVYSINNNTNDNNIKVLYSARIYQQTTCKALIVYRFLQRETLRPNYVALRVYKVIRRIQQPQPGTLGRSPSVFDKRNGFFTRFTQHMGPKALCPIQRMKKWYSWVHNLPDQGLETKVSRPRPRQSHSRN